FNYRYKLTFLIHGKSIAKDKRQVVKRKLTFSLFEKYGKIYLLGSISSFRSAAEKLAEAIFEPKKILHTRRSKCVRRARRDSAEAFFLGQKPLGANFSAANIKLEVCPNRYYLLFKICA
ncbi:MAG: hypothetical protein II957_01925, partial [Treponema sp.]|nr:hypothetical protein [Treponema sp.]